MSDKPRVEGPSSYELSDLILRLEQEKNLRPVDRVTELWALKAYVQARIERVGLLQQLRQTEEEARTLKATFDSQVDAWKAVAQLNEEKAALQSEVSRLTRERDELHTAIKALSPDARLIVHAKLRELSEARQTKERG